MFRFSDKVWKGMQMTEVMTLLKSTSGHSLVKSFSGSDLTLQPFSTGKLFNVSEEPVSDIQSLSALLQRLENDPKHTVIRGSLTCLGPLKLCQYLLTNGVAKNGTETVFG